MKIPPRLVLRSALIATALLVFWAFPAAAASPETSPGVPPHAGALRAWLLYATPPPPDGALDAPGLAPAALPDTVYEGSPIDTLQKSPLEAVFWGRHGVVRGLGLFRSDRENPANDLRRMAKVRRSMLGLHQLVGLATVASMTVTVVGGQRAIEGKGADLHEASLPVTIGLYATTATLAFTSPPSLLPERGFDTVTLHKALALLHVAGMIVTPMLAPDEEGGRDPHVHQALGYATYAVFTTGMIVVTFFR